MEVQIEFKKIFEKNLNSRVNFEYSYLRIWYFINLIFIFEADFKYVSKHVLCSKEIIKAGIFH